MSQAQLEIQLIVVLTAVACALPGSLLVLRRSAMLTDAISHAVLPGLVAGFLVAGRLDSPLLLLFAVLAGVLTAALVEILRRHGGIREDAAIGLVFPALFSLGVIGVVRYAGDVHLDLDAVLMGEVAMAPFDRIYVDGRDWGPRGLWVATAALLGGGAFLAILWKELKLATFDAALADLLGFRPAALQYLLAAVVSATIVAAFDVVGAVLVVALFVAPASAAWLLTDRLPTMLALAALLGAGSAVAGFWGATAFDVSIAGMIATSCGLVMALAVVFAPDRGLVAVAHRRRAQALRFAFRLLLVHLYQHEHAPDADHECRRTDLHHHLQWPPARTTDVLRRAVDAGLVVVDAGMVHLTPRGRNMARRALETT